MWIRLLLKGLKILNFKKKKTSKRLHGHTLNKKWGRKEGKRFERPYSRKNVVVLDSHLMSLLIELAFSLAASVNDWTRCRIESLVLAGLVGALMVRLPGCCWNSSRMSAASDAGVAACERDGLDAYCRCWARCCDCVPVAAVVAEEGGRSEGAIDGSASSASAERSPEENLNKRPQRPSKQLNANNTLSPRGKTRV